MSDKVTVTLVTCGSQKEAERIGETLVRKKLAACVNIVPGVTSIYFWEGRFCKAPEWLLVIKSRGAKRKSIVARIKALHGYKVPEIISFPISSGNPEYLDWVRDGTA